MAPAFRATRHFETTAGSNTIGRMSNQSDMAGLSRRGFLRGAVLGFLRGAVLAGGGFVAASVAACTSGVVKLAWTYLIP